MFTVKKTNKYFKSSKSVNSTLENTPEFLPSDNEDSEEDEESENGLPTYVPRHLPSFPSKHSFRQTPVSIMLKPDNYLSLNQKAIDIY